MWDKLLKGFKSVTEAAAPVLEAMAPAQVPKAEPSQVPVGAVEQAGGAGELAALADRSPIHIAPVGVNLGAMFLPYMEGSIQNGGFGLDPPSRYLTTGYRTAPLPAQPLGLSWEAMACIGGGIVLLSYLLLRKG